MNTAFKFFAVSALVSTSLFASGRPFPGGPTMGMPMPFERPVGKAQLHQIEGDGRYPRPTELTVLRRNNSKTYSSFKLVEDTGIRCIKAPCPSYKTSQFYVTNLRTTKDGSVYYQANNRPVLIMGIVAPGPDFKLRSIEVADHSNNTRLRYKYQLVLKLKGQFEMNTFGGNLEN